MQPFIVLFHDPANMAPADPPLTFACMADDANHAEEQCQNAEPRSRILWVSATADDDKALQEYWGNHV